MALKGHRYISFSLHYINFDLCEKILCDYVYIIILHVYIIILHVYINILHVYIIILHVYIIIYTCIYMYTLSKIGSSNNGWWHMGARLKNAYELLNLRTLKISTLYKNHIFQCMGKIFCVEFQKVPLKFHTIYLAHTLKDVNFIQRWKFKSS